MLRGSLVIPDDATQPTTPYLIRKNDKVVLDRPTKLSIAWAAGVIALTMMLRKD
jgi:hypothetical protein